MNYASAGGISEFVVTIGAFLVLCLITYAFFISGEQFVERIGENGLKVIMRLMGLILAVIGVQVIIHGIGRTISDYRSIGPSESSSHEVPLEEHYTSLQNLTHTTGEI
jgi:multiple antibiotic resistance protein